MRTHWRVIILIGTILSIICARAAGAQDAAVSRYDLRLDTAANGPARATLTLVLDRVEAASAAVVPFPFAEARNVALAQGPEGTLVAVEETNGQARLLLTLPPGTRTPIELRLTCEVHGAISDPGPAARIVRLALLNTERAPIRDLRFVITFPDGLRGHAIRDARPAAGKTEAGPRAVLDAIDGRSGARLQVGALPQGETAALRVELARARPSSAWLLAGLVLGALYLVSFRDLIRPPVR